MSQWYVSFRYGLPVARRARAGQLWHPARSEQPLHGASSGSGWSTHSPMRRHVSSHPSSSSGKLGSRSSTQWLAFPRPSMKTPKRPAPQV